MTVVVPMRNEAQSIIECLDSILANRLPQGDIEVLVFDGASTDNSAELVRQMSRSEPRVRLFTNQQRIQAAAINQGLAMARGKYLARVDAHSRIPPDYLASAIEVLERTAAANVGGRIEARGLGRWAEAVAVAYGSRFGLGHDRHSPCGEEREVDSVSFGCWQTEALRSVGGMDTSLAINEDYEVNARLREHGHTIIWSPSIRSTYFVRSTPGSLARQYFRYGLWKVKMLLSHPRSVRWRQLAAPSLVLSFLSTPFLVLALGPLGSLHVGAYLAASIIASGRAARRSGWRHFPLLPVVFFVVHTCWGSGFLLGWIHWPLNRDAPRAAT